MNIAPLAAVDLDAASSAGPAEAALVRITPVRGQPDLPDERPGAALYALTGQAREPSSDRPLTPPIVAIFSRVS